MWLSPEQKRVLKSFAANNMKLRDSAKALNYSDGGVKYILEGIKRETGLDPRKFYDLVTLLGLTK